MSATKIGKIIAEQSNALMDQRERIRKIYDPNNMAARSSSSNIKVTDEFPSINSKNMKNGVSGMNPSFTNDSRHISQRYNNPNRKTADSMPRSEDKSKPEGNMIYSDVKSKEIEGATELNRREPIGVEELIRAKRNDGASHSLLGNLSGTENRIAGVTSKENSTVSIKSKKTNFHNGYEQSLSNVIKYDTTAVISEEYSNFEDPFTQMYTNSILSG